MTVNTVERLTRLGKVRGIERLGVETYRGLRYAEPVQRFRAAVLATTPWTDVRDATRYGAIPPQSTVLEAVYGPTPDAPFAEDCLVLNIHTPKAVAASPRPVIFFIHGGSFTGGSGNFYDGTALANGADAVVVCINYRLGVFGAFDLDWLGTGRDGGGQLWLGDQITALQWVRANITDYGGNPELVTIIGESAGAVSVAALCAAPQAAGLVHRAVACSTGYLVADPSNDVVAVIAKARRCTRAQAVEFMRMASTDELMDLQKRGKQLSPKPVAMTPLLPGTMEELIRARGAQAVPMIAGYATHEGASLEMMLRLAIKLPGPVLALLSHLVSLGIAGHAAKGKAHAKAYLKRLKKATGVFGFGRAFNDLVWTDGFRRGAMDYTAETTRAGSRGYVYEMDIPMRFAGQMIESSHGIDLALTFNVWEDPEHTVPAFAEHPQAAELGRRWVRMLGHFARTGEPGDALGDWPVFDDKTHSAMRIAPEGCKVEQDAAAVFRKRVWI